ncbi:Growth_factor receptor cysteine-rich domain superfamily [Hexamita inflata]|uniref:Growth factor receptor cysteine-rich domain superfamily n=1 Tax=Hexamita inflata TaxID=28002 RepID=A0AA86QRU6_9EUKA|nr:Growth factor receptor cysteine-rich domain superfamily [Hexamita inflata]
MKCDISITNSRLIFIASGSIISGVILQARSLVFLLQTSVQSRFESQHSSSIVSNISKLELNYSLASTNILNYDSTGISSYISSFTHVYIKLNVQNVSVCSNNFAISENTLYIDHQFTISEKCENICDDGYYAYGICIKSVQFAQLHVNFTYLCFDPFEFNGEFCSCKYGYLLNQSSCVDIINKLDYVQQNLEEMLLSNISRLETRVNTITTRLDQNIANNVSYVLLQLTNNSAALERNIINNLTLAAQNLISNFSVLDKRILNNITVVTNQISNQASQISSLQSSLSQTQIDQDSIGSKLSSIQTVLSTLKYVYIDSNRNACDQYGCYKV